MHDGQRSLESNQDSLTSRGGGVGKQEPCHGPVVAKPDKMDSYQSVATTRQTTEKLNVDWFTSVCHV